MTEEWKIESGALVVFLTYSTIWTLNSEICDGLTVFEEQVLVIENAENTCFAKVFRRNFCEVLLRRHKACTS